MHVFTTDIVCSSQVPVLTFKFLVEIRQSSLRRQKTKEFLSLSTHETSFVFFTFDNVACLFMLKETSKPLQARQDQRCVLQVDIRPVY